MSQPPSTPRTRAARLAGLAFDLIVLDVMMPGENGLDLTESLRATSDVPILLLTAMARPTTAWPASSAAPTTTWPSVRAARAATAHRARAAPGRSATMPARVVRFGAFVFDPARAELLRGGDPVRLTSGEAALMGVFAANPGLTLTRQTLSRESRLGGNERAVDVHIARLRRKVEPDPKSPRYLQTVWGEGYVLRADHG